MVRLLASLSGKLYFNNLANYKVLYYSHMGHSGVILVSRIDSWWIVNGFNDSFFEQLHQSENILLCILSAYFSFIVTEADNDWSH